MPRPISRKALRTEYSKWYLGTWVFCKLPCCHCKLCWNGMSVDSCVARGGWSWHKLQTPKYCPQSTTPPCPVARENIAKGATWQWNTISNKGFRAKLWPRTPRCLPEDSCLSEAGLRDLKLNKAQTILSLFALKHASQLFPLQSKKGLVDFGCQEKTGQEQQQARNGERLEKTGLAHPSHPAHLSRSDFPTYVCEAKSWRLQR